MLDIKTPYKVYNNFSCSLNNNEILIIGGKREVENNKKFEYKDTSDVLLYNVKHNKFKNLPNFHPFYQK